MSERRHSQLHRILYVLRDLDRAWSSRTTLAQRYGVTAKTIRRDIQFLQAHGFAIHKRVPAITDSEEVEWHLVAYPSRYDLTQAQAVKQVQEKASA